MWSNCRQCIGWWQILPLTLTSKTFSLQVNVICGSSLILQNCTENHFQMKELQIHIDFFFSAKECMYICQERNLSSGMIFSVLWENRFSMISKGVHIYVCIINTCVTKFNKKESLELNGFSLDGVGI